MAKAVSATTVSPGPDARNIMNDSFDAPTWPALKRKINRPKTKSAFLERTYTKGQVLRRTE